MHFSDFFIGWAGNCGDGGVGGSSWYIICEKCRSTYMSQLAVPHQPQQPRELTEVKNRANAFFKPRKKSLTSGFALNSSQINSHIIMTNNAMFLLDLASSASNPNLVNATAATAASSTSLSAMAASSSSYSKKLMTTSIGGLSAVSELESMDPNPFPLVPFQCFNKLGVRDSHLRLINDELVLDEVLKISDVKEASSVGVAAASENATSSTFEAAEAVENSEITPPEQFQNSFHQNEGGCHKKPFNRSVSVGNHVLRGCQKTSPSEEGFSRKRNSSSEQPDVGGDFLSNPSASLQRLFTCDRAMVADILQRPVMSFVLQWNDLESLQIGK